MLPTTSQVAAPATGGVPSGMPAQIGTPAVGSTPILPGASNTGASDAEELKRQLEEARSNAAAIQEKYERDLSGLRSSLDRERSKLQKDWENERNEWRRKWDEAQTAGMDEQARTQYEYKRALERQEELQATLAERERALEEQQAKSGYLAWFLNMGVPAQELNMGASLEDLLAAGWGYLQDELQTLRSKPGQAPAAPAAPAPATPAPNVLTNVSGSPVSAPSVEKLVKDVSDRLGRPVTEEEFWRMVENRQLNIDMNSVLRDMAAPR